MKIVYAGQLTDASGYGSSARGYIDALRTTSLDFQTLNLSFEDAKVPFDLSEHSWEVPAEPFCLIWHLPAPSFQNWIGRNPAQREQALRFMREARCSINLSTWEADGIPEVWGQIYKAYGTNAIIVPSTWNKPVFERTGLPVFVLPHVLETQPGSEPLPDLAGITKEKFKVLSVSQFNYRKGFDKLIRAFTQEFAQQDDCVLMLKTYISLMGEGYLDQLKGQISSLKAPGSRANIVLISSLLSRENMNWLYEEADLFALPTRGEGFGLPLAEAAMAGLPVLCPVQTGQADFIKTPFDVAGSWEPVEFSIEHSYNTNWFEPSLNSIRKQLRIAYEKWRTDRLAPIGLETQKHILGLGWDRKEIGKRFVEIIEHLEKQHEAKPQTIKERARTLKNILRIKETFEEKMALLKGSFEGETATILTCGPSLGDWTPAELQEKLKDEFVVAVKQAIFAGVEADMHFWNCSNLPPINQQTGQHYQYGFREPIVVASSNYPIGARWHPAQKHDLFFRIPTRLETDKVLSVDMNFEDYTFDKGFERKFIGAGLNYETLFYMLVWMGFKRLKFIGYDLAPIGEATMDKNILSSAIKDYKHFYDEKLPVANKGDMVVGEARQHILSSEVLYGWLKSQGIELELVQKTTPSYLWEGIPRVSL